MKETTKKQLQAGLLAALGAVATPALAEQGHVTPEAKDVKETPTYVQKDIKLSPEQAATILRYIPTNDDGSFDREATRQMVDSSLALSHIKTTRNFLTQVNENGWSDKAYDDYIAKLAILNPYAIEMKEPFREVMKQAGQTLPEHKDNVSRGEAVEVGLWAVGLVFSLLTVMQSSDLDTKYMRMLFSSLGTGMALGLCVFRVRHLDEKTLTIQKTLKEDTREHIVDAYQKLHQSCRDIISQAQRQPVVYHVSLQDMHAYLKNQMQRTR